MSRTLYIVDGHSQIYRAYYAPFRALTAPSGEPTRATFVFWQMLLNLVRDRRPDYLAMALDTSDETVFRKAIHPEYKSHRDPPPEDLGPQFDRIIGMAEAVGLPLLRLPGYEADDIMATLVHRLAGPELHVYLVSRDKDLDQLLSEHTSLYDPMKAEVITPQKLFELKGWTPQQAIEAQILTGDSVDNVPGAAGIGPKTAAKLIQKYGTALGAIEHADELTPRQRDNLRAFAPQVETARQLLTLAADVPIELDLRQAEIRRLRWDALRPFIAELGMRRLLPHLPGAPAGEQADDAPHELAGMDGAPDGAAATEGDASADSDRDAGTDARGPGGPVSPHAAGERDSMRAATEAEADWERRAAALIDPAWTQRAAQLAQPVEGSRHLVDSEAALEELAGVLAGGEAFALDTETTGVHPIDCDLVGLAFSSRAGEGWYVPVRSIYGEPLPIERLRARLGPLLADGARTKVGHNIKYDLVVLGQAGLPVAGPLFDTMIASFVLDPGQASLGLDALVRRHFGHAMIDIADIIGKGRDQLSMMQAPLEQVSAYAGADADYTWRLHQLMAPALRGSDLEELFERTEMPLVGVLADMERRGVRIDVELLRELGRRMAGRAAQIVDEVHALVGTRFNLDSPKQLADVLFDRLGFRVVRRTKTTRSTDADTLETLARETQHPALALLLEYRELQKLRGTYVDALPLAVSKRSGRVHTSFHQTGAVTGRLSSSEPNLQNIPVRTELGRQIRRAFIPADGHLLVVADYSQIELRVLAHFSQDEALCRAFAEDRDIHAFVAAQTNGVPIEQVTREMRDRAKAVNFGIIYGQTAFGLSQGTGMSRGEAQAFIDAYFERYPRIRAFIHECIESARRQGFVRTLLGRRRPIPDIDSRNRAAKALAERLAVNTVVQGSAADLIKLAMIRLHERIERERLPLRMLLQVHDELVCEAPRERAEEMCGRVAEEMRGAMTLRVPLRVDARSAANWLEAK